MEVTNCYSKDAKFKHKINLDLIEKIPVTESTLKNNIISKLNRAVDSGITVQTQIMKKSQPLFGTIDE